MDNTHYRDNSLTFKTLASGYPRLESGIERDQCPKTPHPPGLVHALSRKVQNIMFLGGSLLLCHCTLSHKMIHGHRVVRVHEGHFTKNMIDYPGQPCGTGSQNNHQHKRTIICESKA